MKKYLSHYVQTIDEQLKRGDIEEFTIQQHLIKIEFFQHERLIHLFVTLTYAFLTFLSFAFSIFSYVFALIGILLMCFLLPYVRYYFFIENRVQYLYKQYDKMIEQNKKKTLSN